MKKFSTKQKLIYSIIAFFSLIIVSFSTLTIVRGIHFSKIQSANILSIQQQNDLETLLQNEYSHKNTIFLRPLPPVGGGLCFLCKKIRELWLII